MRYKRNLKYDVLSPYDNSHIFKPFEVMSQDQRGVQAFSNFRVCTIVSVGGFPIAITLKDVSNILSTHPLCSRIYRGIKHSNIQSVCVLSPPY